MGLRIRLRIRSREVGAGIQSISTAPFLTTSIVIRRFNSKLGPITPEKSSVSRILFSTTLGIPSNCNSTQWGGMGIELPRRSMGANRCWRVVIISNCNAMLTYRGLCEHKAYFRSGVQEDSKLLPISIQFLETSRDYWKETLIYGSPHHFSPIEPPISNYLCRQLASSALLGRVLPPCTDGSVAHLAKGTISSRRYPKMPGRRFLTGWTAPLLWPRPPTPPSRVSPTPHRCGSSSGGCSPRPAPNWLSSPPTAITASSPTGTEKPWNWRLTIAATPRSRTRYATSSTASG